MTMGCPSTILIGSVTGPPAGKGATQVTGRLGKSSAIATNDTMGKAAAPAAKRIIGRRGSCMMFSHWLARLAAGSAESAADTTNCRLSLLACRRHKVVKFANIEPE